MADMSFGEYRAMLEDGAGCAEIVEYRHRRSGALEAAIIVDRLSDGLSLVYSFFNPAREAASPGQHMILDHVARALEEGLGYVYLGYWVNGSRKMGYKARYQPLELLGRRGWRAMTKAEAEAARAATLEEANPAEQDAARSASL